MVLVGEEHADVPREALQEEDSKEDIGVLIFSSSMSAMSSDGLLLPRGSIVCRSSTLTLGELMAGQQRLLQLSVGLHWIRSNYQVNNSLQGLFI